MEGEAVVVCGREAVVLCEGGAFARCEGGGIVLFKYNAKGCRGGGLCDSNPSLRHRPFYILRGEAGGRHLL